MGKLYKLIFISFFVIVVSKTKDWLFVSCMHLFTSLTINFIDICKKTRIFTCFYSNLVKKIKSTNILTLSINNQLMLYVNEI